MIDQALDVIKTEVAEYLTRLPELNIGGRTPVELTAIVEENGNYAIPDDSIGITLVNVEEERSVKSQVAISQAPDGRVSHQNPEVKLNLYVLFSANFKTYVSGLEFLSGVVRFFQGKNVFTPSNTPALPQAIRKLIAELYSLDFEQQNHLWGALGAKYLPSVIYRLRLVTIQEAQKSDEQEPIKTISLAEGGLN